MRYILLAIGLVIGFLIGFYSASFEVKQDDDDVDIQKYIYRDSFGRIHCKNRCINLLKNELGVSFIEVDSITDSMLNMVCPMCFTDNLYQEICNKHKKDSVTDVSKYFQ